MPGQLWEVVGGADKGGILVRAGHSIKSPELSNRVSTGALLLELELQGERLHYYRLAGEGPLCGWVSLKVKDKDLLLRSDKQRPPAAGEEAEREQRPYGIIVYGATGYTGTLICQHLDAMLARPGAQQQRWAVAGRNAERLRELSGRLKSQPAVVVAQSEEEVAAMTADCRVVINAAGPYALCGEPVVRACVASRTDYVDITGEVYWVKEMIDKYDAAAKENGVALVHMCGQDSAPPDVSVNLLVQHLGPLKQVRVYMMSAGGMSGGTHFTGQTTWSKNADKAFASQQDPFHLGGVRRGSVRPIDGDCTEPEQCPLFPSLWLGAGALALADTRCVRRSCGLFEDAGDALRYGADFTVIYRDVASSKQGAVEQIRMNGPLPVLGFAPKICELLQEAVDGGKVARPGGGAPPETRKHFFSVMISTAEGEDGRWAYCEHTAPEAYEVTAICSVAAALVLCEERDALRAGRRSGCLTPAFAFWGTSFMERLRTSPFAGTSERSMAWRLRDGKPPEDLAKAAVKDRARTMAQVFEGYGSGELKAF